MSLMTLTRGDLKTFTLQLTNPDGSALDLTGLDLTFTAKRSIWDADADAVFTKTVGSGITVDDPTSGTAEIEFTPDETAAMSDLRSLRCDLQVQSGEDVKTPWKGKLKILPDVTRTST